MSSISGIAQSGLQVDAMRLTVSADNVANANTDRFVPSQVQAQALPEGGVAGKVVPDNEPQFEAQIDQNIVSLSGTDLGKEMVNQMEAAASYRANLATVRTADEVAGVLINTVG